MARFGSILIANRGEIALRIIKTAGALGCRTVAVYSETDQDAPHVRHADDAVCIGTAPAGESYLAAEKIINAARTTGADAIHPGYGFLSENADFARACKDANLVFIGPPPDAIDLMGNKAAAKRRMIKAGVACVPGYEGRDQSDAALAAAASSIGFPIMVKAAAGGGGRGMRLAETMDDLETALRTARSEAQNAFGSGELILEKAILRPRHVEVQVFADTHGHVVHLGERDCSVQRRHQKVVEEAPCPVMTEDLRARMGAAAVNAAKSIGYCGAGTVEFLLDEAGEFYFLEMNTRLQVEHPVTEMITGLDLVALQIQVAQGEPLGLAQNDIHLNGHAIEARLYAEDPAQDFLPVTGRVDLWRPAAGEGVRIDAGIDSGSEISPFYDPMIAKIIAWGPTREVANNRLVHALDKTRLFGTVTNKGFLIDILRQPVFRAGNATTAFINDTFPEKDENYRRFSLREAAVAAVIQYETGRSQAHRASLGVNHELLNWGSHGLLVSHYRYRQDDEIMDLELVTGSLCNYEARAGDQSVTIHVLERHDTDAVLGIDDRRITVGYYVPAEGLVYLDMEGQTLELRNELAFAEAPAEESGGGRVTAPMHGLLLEVFAAEGEKIEKGARLAVLEAMKMQHDIVAEVSGTVTGICVAAGAQVAADDLIIIIEPDENQDRLRGGEE